MTKNSKASGALLLLLLLAAQTAPHAGAEPAPPLKTFDECLELAFKKSELLGSQAELVNQADEQVSQARAALLPTVSGSGVYQHQPLSTLNPLISQVFPQDQTTIKLTAAQPLFRGFRDIYGLRQKSDQLESQESSKDRAAVQLFDDLAQAFYNVLSFQKDIQNLQDEIDVNKKRLTELKSFNRSGRYRESDVVTTESNIFNLESQVESYAGLLAGARASLAFLTGVPQSEPKDTQDLPSQIPPLEEYLKKSELRPEVLQTKKDYDASELGVTMAWGSHLPSADFTGNYYLLRQGSPISDVKWDISFSATVPIFSWGATQSQVRAAVSDRKNKELLYRRALDQALQEIKTLHATFESDLRQLDKLSQAVGLSDRNVELVRKDFRGGLATNVEVLQAIDTAQQIHRTLDRTRFAAKVDYLKLEAAAVRRPDLQAGLRKE